MCVLGRDPHIHNLVRPGEHHPQLAPRYHFDSVKLAKCCNFDPEDPAFLGQNVPLFFQAGDFVSDFHHFQVRPNQREGARRDDDDTNGDPGDPGR